MAILPKSNVSEQPSSILTRQSTNQTSSRTATALTSLATLGLMFSSVGIAKMFLKNQDDPDENSSEILVKKGIRQENPELLKLFVDSLNKAPKHLSDEEAKSKLILFFSQVPNKDAFDSWFETIKTIPKYALFVQIPEILTDIYRNKISNELKKEEAITKAVHFVLDNLGSKNLEFLKLKEGWFPSSAHLAMHEELSLLSEKSFSTEQQELLKSFLNTQSSGFTFSSLILFYSTIYSSSKTANSQSQEYFQTYLANFSQFFAKWVTFSIDQLSAGKSLLIPLGWNTHCVECLIERKPDGSYYFTAIDTAFFLKQHFHIQNNFPFIPIDLHEASPLKNEDYWQKLFLAKKEKTHQLFVELISQLGKVDENFKPPFSLAPKQYSGTCTILSQIASLHWTFLTQSSDAFTGQALFEQTYISLQEQVWNKTQELFNPNVQTMGSYIITKQRAKWQKE